MELKDRILSKADDICRKVGFRAMTLDDIASHLCISKKTIYQYFTDKDELVDAIMSSEIEKSKNDCLTIKEIAENAVDEFFLSLEAMTQDFNDTNPIVLHDLQKFHPRTFLKIQYLKNDFYYSIIYDNLQRGIEEGLYISDFNLDIITKMRLETMVFPFQQEIFPIAKYDFITVNEVMCHHFLYGILTDKGRKLLSKYKKNT